MGPGDQGCHPLPGIVPQRNGGAAVQLELWQQVTDGSHGEADLIQLRCYEPTVSKEGTRPLSKLKVVIKNILRAKGKPKCANSDSTITKESGDDGKKKKELVEVNGSLRTVWNQCWRSPWVRQTQTGWAKETVREEIQGVRVCHDEFWGDECRWKACPSGEGGPKACIHLQGIQQTKFLLRGFLLSQSP